MFGDEEDKLNIRRMFNELCHTNYYSPQCLLWQVFEAAQSSSVRGCTAVVHSAEKGLLSKEGETPLLYRPVWSPSNTAVHLVCQVRIKNTKRSPNFSIPCTSLKFGQIIGLHLNDIFDTGPVTGSVSVKRSELPQLPQPASAPAWPVPQLPPVPENPPWRQLFLPSK